MECWTLTFGAAGWPALDTDLGDGGEDGAISAAFAHHVDDPVCDSFNRHVAAAAAIGNLLENAAILTSGEKRSFFPISIIHTDTCSGFLQSII